MAEVRQTDLFKEMVCRRFATLTPSDGSRRGLFALQSGLLGDVKPVGDGVSELRVDYGPGYTASISFDARSGGRHSGLRRRQADAGARHQPRETSGGGALGGTRRAIQIAHRGCDDEAQDNAVRSGRLSRHERIADRASRRRRSIAATADTSPNALGDHRACARDGEGRARNGADATGALSLVEQDRRSAPHDASPCRQIAWPRNCRSRRRDRRLEPYAPHVPLGFARAVGAAAAGSSGQKWRG